jgi:hypothetical protein
MTELPQETTWKLLAVSPDMVDTRFCNKAFPFRWRSSLALSAFEPKPPELPNILCEGRITFLKITATIAGYQPSREETAAAYVSFPDIPTEEISRIIDQYFACYGALLNVAVFPNPKRKLVDRLFVVDFRQQRPGTQLPNPYESEGASFNASDHEANSIVDNFPADGDGEGELDIFQEMVVKIPSTSKVEAQVVHNSEIGVTMQAFSGETLISSVVTGVEQNQIHKLVTEGNGIDRVVFTSPENNAMILEFAYTGKESKPFDLIEFPHFIDAEPKIRDLIQAATESGEILTSSKSNIKTNKSLTHTDSSETGFKLGAGISPAQAKGGYSASGEMTHKNTETEQDNWTVATDASRERQEKEGTTTQISQLYNLLSSYHIGTNRVQFLMLARPHVLQPTDHRTFVNGLRFIEGVQEFILSVARPPEMQGLCVEAFLETGHFPEGLTPQQPPEEFEEKSEEFMVTAFADNGWFSGSCSNIEATHTVESGWVVDTRSERGPDPGHPGLQMILDESNEQAKQSLENHNYQRIADGTVQVSGRICGEAGQQDKARFKRTYRVFTRSMEPKPTTGGNNVPMDKLLITSRGLCVCFKSGENCPILDPPIFIRPDQAVDPIVDEKTIAISRMFLKPSVVKESRLSATKEFLAQIRTAMTTSGRLIQRRPFDKAPGFLGSDYFKDKIKTVLSRGKLDTSLANVGDLPRQVLDAFGGSAKVAEVLDLDLMQFAKKTGLSLGDAVGVRGKLLGTTEVKSSE